MKDIGWLPAGVRFSDDVRYHLNLAARTFVRMTYTEHKSCIDCSKFTSITLSFINLIRKENKLSNFAFENASHPVTGWDSYQKLWQMNLHLNVLCRSCCGCEQICQKLIMCFSFVNQRSLTITTNHTTTTTVTSNDGGRTTAATVHFKENREKEMNTITKQFSV